MTKEVMTKGVNLTDHITERNGVIVMECKVTNTPLVTYEGNLISSQNADTRIHSAYAVIKNLWKKSTACSIVHKFDTHYDMVLTEQKPIILPSNSVGFRLKFEEARFVDEKRISLVTNMSAKKAKDARAAKQKESGDGKAGVTEFEYIAWKALKDTGIQASNLATGNNTTEVK